MSYWHYTSKLEHGQPLEQAKMLQNEKEKKEAKLAFVRFLKIFQVKNKQHS